MESPFKLSYTQSKESEDKQAELLNENYGPFKEELTEDSEAQTDNQELEFEFFASQSYDPEFEDTLTDLAREAEEKFSTFVGTPEIGEVAIQPNFEEKFNQFFNSEYQPMVQTIENEIDHLSSYLIQNIQPEMNLEQIENIVDNFQPVEPEQFFGKIGKFFKKVGKAVKSVAGKVVKTAWKLGKTVALGPLNIILSKIIKKFKPFILPFLKRVVRAGIRRIPSQYRTLVGQLAKKLKLGELEAPGFSNLTQFQQEGTDELELEDEAYGITMEGPYEETELESDYQEFPQLSEMELGFDRYAFNITNDELSGNTQIIDHPISASEYFNFEYQDQNNLEGLESQTLAFEKARDDYIMGLSTESPDVELLTENFIPAILMAIKFGLKLIGRKRVVNLIAKLVAKLIGPLVGKNLASPLSKVLVDVGLRMMSLEAPESMSREKVLASTIANLVGETVERVSELPDSILDSEDEVLQSFVQEALYESAANNFPVETLKDEILEDRVIPTNGNWILRNKGRYKVFSKEYRTIITPRVARRIFTLRRGERLYDVLRKKAWDGKTPLPVVIKVIEATPGTRLSMISKDYFGGSSPEQIRQILPLTRKAARLLLNTPELAMRRISRSRSSVKSRFFIKRYYIVKPVTPGVAISSPKPMRQQIKNNDVNFKLIQPKTVELRVYLNEETARKIKNASRDLLIAKLTQSTVNLIMTLGAKIIYKSLSRLKIPKIVAKGLANLLLRWAQKNLSIKAKELADKFIKAVDQPAYGVTIRISLELPTKISDLLKLNVISLAGFLSNIIKKMAQITLEVIPGYRL